MQGLKFSIFNPRFLITSVVWDLGLIWKIELKSLLTSLSVQTQLMVYEGEKIYGSVISNNVFCKVMTRCHLPVVNFGGY